MRRPFALAVIALHGLLLWLLALGFRQHDERVVELPQFVSMWITPLAPVVQVLPPPTLRPPAREKPKQQAAAEPPPAVPVAAPITPAPEPPTAPAAVAAPPVDWANAARLAARRASEAAARPKSDTFSPPPKTLPKTCVPKKKSMEFNGKEDRRVGVTGGLPYIKLNDRCVLLVIIPMCVLGKLPEANGHLLDDLSDPDRSHSSVPDPNVCD